MHRVTTTLSIALLAMLPLAGCGYSSGGGDKAGDGYHWRNIYRDDVRSVAVPIFRSVSFDRGVEFNLSKALVSQIEANTPYKVLPRERADTILEGEIVQVGVNTLSNNTRAGNPQEQLLDVRINFTWKDLRSGRILVERRNLEQTATYYPTLGEGRFVGTQEASERLALSIVQEMQSDW